MSRSGLAEAVETPWPIRPLAELAETFFDGDWIESKDQSPSGVRLLQTGNVGEGEFKDRAEKARFISTETFARLNCTEVFAGDILVSRLPEPVGRACLVPESNARMITAVDCSIVRLDERVILPKFFVYFTQSEDYLSAVAARCTGATRSRISRSALGRIEIPIPSLDEQKRTVAALDQAFAALDPARANVEESLRDARLVFDSHLREMFSTGRGKTWDTTALGVLADFRNGINFTKASRGKEVRVLGVKDFQNHFHAPDTGLDRVTIDDDLDSRDCLQSGDIVFVRSNGNPELIGRSLVIERMSERTAHSGFTIRARLRDSKLVPGFLAHFLKSSAVRRQMVDGGTGTNINSLNQGTLSRILVPCPPRSEQMRIVEHLEVVRKKASHAESRYTQQLTDVAALRQSLLHAAFSGQLS